MLSTALYAEIHDIDVLQSTPRNEAVLLQFDESHKISIQLFTGLHLEN